MSRVADNGEKSHVRNQRIDIAVFTILLVAVSAVTYTLFYRQVYGSTAGYHSDMKAYILEMQGLESGYSFPYPVFFKFSALLHMFMAAEPAVAVATMLLNSLGIVVTKLAFNSLALPALEKGIQARLGGIAGRHDVGWAAGVVISLVSVSLFFISMLYPPTGIYLPGIKFKYLGVFTANPFHNATYMAARPFAIIAFLWFAKLLPVYEKGAAVADYVLFSLFLLAATMTKPSFTLVLVSTAGLIMLYRLVRSVFHNFIPTLWLGLCFIPTFLDLLYQFKGVFVPEEGEEGGLGFCFGEIWAQYCSNIPLAICLAVGFPLLVLVLNYKEFKKNTLFLFSWQLYLVDFAETFLLYEKGSRKYDFNFSWGYMYGIFFCHFCALLLLLKVTARRLAGETGEAEGKKEGMANGRIGTVLLIGQWLAYLWHLVCGIAYFNVFLKGAMYY